MLEHARATFEQLDTVVEGAARDHIDRDVGVAVVDAFVSGGAGDDREHHDAESVHESGVQE